MRKEKLPDQLDKVYISVAWLGGYIKLNKESFSISMLLRCVDWKRDVPKLLYNIKSLSMMFNREQIETIIILCSIIKDHPKEEL